jgi:hypothetical protein
MLTAPQHMQTFETRSPLATHFRTATCEEYGCAAHERGWVTHLDESLLEHAKGAHWIRADSRMKFREERNGQLVSFTFEAGQTCFEKHQVPVDRPAFYQVRAGDLHARGPVVRHHTSGESWMDDLHTTTDRIVTAIERG